ncbi:MAG: hypothetical protein KAJ86_06475 [Alphaproteobacteria bacterium]|nr:hypothetical protein [Alphaproteobacteria bacterium]
MTNNNRNLTSKFERNKTDTDSTKIFIKRITLFEVEARIKADPRSGLNPIKITEKIRDDILKNVITKSDFLLANIIDNSINNIDNENELSPIEIAKKIKNNIINNTNAVTDIIKKDNNENVYIFNAVTNVTKEKNNKDIYNLIISAKILANVIMANTIASVKIEHKNNPKSTLSAI